MIYLYNIYMPTTNKTRKHNKTQKKKKVTKSSNKKEYIFSLEDYKSGDGMLTSVWGPSLWHSLHTISFNYPDKPTKLQKKEYMSFIKSLVNVLPCRYCRENLVKNFKVLPLTMREMNSRETFSRYIYNLHELINTMLLKKSNLTYEDVRERYEHFRSRCSKTKKQPKRQKVKSKKEKGCTKSEHGRKTKCVIKIVPFKSNEETFQITKKCFS